jgi:lipase
LVVGHSMGGTVAVIAEVECSLNAAAMILMEPIFLMEELYRRLTHINKHPVASKTLKRTNQWGDEEELRQYLKSKPLFQNWAEGMLEPYIRYGFRTDPLGEVHLRPSLPKRPLCSWEA